MKWIVFLFFVFFAIILEVSVFSLPLTLLVIILFAVMLRNGWVFPVAFVAGIILDSLFFSQVGVRSMFLIAVIAIVYLYQNKFEIHTGEFAAFSSFLASFLYLLFFGSQNIFLQSFVSALLGAALFLVMTKATNFLQRKHS
ncbi:MAG: hypothetical protein ACREGI_03050 [Candidatus Levyibacteriota bacterium]